MAQPFLGEIRTFPWAFAPRGWALCTGSLLSIQQNSALFALLGIQYGGNGTTTFALPDLRGRGIVHQGVAADGGSYVQGTLAGTETVSLTPQMIPAHVHFIVANADTADKAKPDPGPYYLAKANLPSGTAGEIYAPFANPVTLAPGAVAMTGGNVPHANMQPFLVLNFCIALAGIFPSRG
jgi:microcystin-dependent protein